MLRSYYNNFSTGNSMVSNAIWEKSERVIFKNAKNCTNPKGVCNLGVFEKLIHVFLKIQKKPYYYLIIMYIKLIETNFR